MFSGRNHPQEATIFHQVSPFLLARANYTSSSQLENRPAETRLLEASASSLVNRSYGYLIRSVIKLGLQGG